MLSNSNIFRNIKSISENDKLGLYDLYPSCKYKNDIYNNFENINDEIQKWIIYFIIIFNNTNNNNRINNNLYKNKKKYSS